MEKAKTENLNSNMDQIPFQAIEAIGKIFAEGEIKYGRDNWKKGEGDESYQRERLNHAILHLQKYANGDISEHHLAKVAWFCVTQLYFESKKPQSIQNLESSYIKPNLYYTIPFTIGIGNYFLPSPETEDLIKKGAKKARVKYSDSSTDFVVLDDQERVMARHILPICTAIEIVGTLI